MNTRSPFAVVLAAALTACLAMPPGVPAQAASAGQRAGQVTRVIPTTTIQRAGQPMAAAARSEVFWQDVVTTDRGGRARIDLEDGSILNLGSESSLTISKHDGSTQQTELDLAYGRIRANAARLARPGAKFEVKTRSAVAGVVGTDFFLSFINEITQLIVYEGQVRLCDLVGNCVMVGAGQTTFVRSNNPPEQPVSVSQVQSMQAAQATQTTQAAAAAGAAGAAAAAGISTIVVVAAVAAVVATVVVANVANRDDGSKANPRCCP